MASLLDSYEQQYSNVTAEITNKIAKIVKLSGGEKRHMVTNVEKQMEEAKELLEQMDLEVRDIPSKERQKYATRLKSYKTELGKLEKDFKKAKLHGGAGSREELLGPDDPSHSEDQRTRLLDNTERLERSGRKLEAGYRMAVETEQVGADILENLHQDREKIQRSRDRLRETDSDLGKSSRILSAMMRRIIQNRIVLFVVIAVIILVIALTIYFSTRS
ncbi:vesicle transport through interaction with t-SNAREs homolog 1A-like isoform X1 [Branchiostoma floridae]|uniref:Vesicle transport through interaction with t-SNAREs homolog 1A-like isoform X1 n=2 Tax=Branchiostoma floridae TaxID=7739 RepID=A0A9J7KTI8_BRAFL|nr:vesicle transport through interaction with t-SNAREs homolog 1A-like isoform X1 [Branchiostoma floridae]